MRIDSSISSDPSYQSLTVTDNNGRVVPKGRQVVAPRQGQERTSCVLRQWDRGSPVAAGFPFAPSRQKKTSLLEEKGTRESDEMLV
jgi:hypothetical protein